MTLLTKIGNHDITLEESFYASDGSHFHNQTPQVPAECLRLLRDSPSITYLEHGATDIQLRKASGPQTKFKIFGSPYSPAWSRWAFSYQADDAAELWKQIPLDADVVVTHTPPQGHCDRSKDGGATGCEALRQRLWCVRPLLAVCGHVHEGRGVERVEWDDETADGKFRESGTEHWTDPGQGSMKQSLVGFGSCRREPLEHQDRLESNKTVVVNAAIMATSWRHGGPGGKKYNKPIVVDVHLPVDEEKSWGV